MGFYIFERSECTMETREEIMRRSFSKDDISTISESLKQIKIPESGWDEVHVSLGSFDTIEEAVEAAVEKVKELAEGGFSIGRDKCRADSENDR